jgi:Bacterial Ig domain
MTGVNQAINLTLTANDNDSCKDDPLTYTITANPSHGIVTPSSGTGSVQYMPATGYEGPDTFNFTVSDGTWNAQCSDAQVTMFVVNGPTLTTSCQSDGIVLNWSLDSIVQNMEDNYTDGFYIQDFKIYRATSPGGPYTLIDTVSADSRFYVDKNVTANQTYCYVVTFEYYDYYTGITYPTFSPSPGVAPYSNESCNNTCSLPPPPTNGMDVVFIIDNTGL